MKYIILFLLAFFTFNSLSAQITQTVRGVIQDNESLSVLPGANIWVIGSENEHSTSSDGDGNFALTDLPIGRVSIEVQMIGYENQILSELLVTAGKELFLTVNLKPGFTELEEAVVESSDDSQRAINEMATVSSRSFSVEETQRYAASAYDPGRMALAFSGVVSSGDDLLNEISIRGNSPRGMAWRLEGIEIPNPNHFGALGSSGGGISMLSSSTLSSSDFYTGAFPAEFGNASSGIFDLNLRVGNNRVREHSLMIGALGVEASTEGYFSKQSKGSYLFNYRYSTFALLSSFYNPIGDILPTYSDMSFKMNFPETPIGSISIFGLGGSNYIIEDIEADSTLVPEERSYDSFRADQTVGVTGIKNIIRLNDKAYIKNVVSLSVNHYTDESYEHDSLNTDFKELYDVTDFEDNQLAFRSTINYKLNQRNTLRAGGNFALKSYDLTYDFKDLDEDRWINLINSDGTISQLDVFAQLKRRMTENLTGNLGVHFTYLPFNDTYSIEPRAALSYTTPKKKEWNVAVGLHSKPEHTSTFFLNKIEDETATEQAVNKDLEIPKALHAVLGHKFRFGEKTLVSVEAYYQYHFDIPVEQLDTSIFSTAVVSDIWGIVGRNQLVSEGEARNYGIDISLQRPLSNNYYFMTNASIYKAEYSTYSGKWFNSLYNGDYVVSLTGGKEWQLKKPHKSIGINAKFIASGGNRLIPVDLEASLAQGEGVYQFDQAFTEHAGNYLRLDFGISYKINRKNSTHTILLDVQNVTGNQNIYTKYFNEDNLTIESVYQLGVFPFFNYRIEFQGKNK